MLRLSDMTLNANYSVTALSFLRWLPLLFVISTAVQAEEQENEAFKWLERMWQAVHQLNYEGTFVYLHDNHMESLRLVHSVADGQERERLTSLNGVSREVVRDNHSIICVLPDSRSVSAELRSSGGGIGENSVLDPKKLSAYYDFYMHGDSRIAGRPAVMLVIAPKDAYRYGHRLFLDKEYALPLKTELLDSNGESISQIMFTGLKVDPEIKIAAEGDDSALENEHYAWIYQKPVLRMQDGERTAVDWYFPNLPAGFQLSVHARRPATDKRSAIDHFVFTDGLATFSVYVEKADSNNGLEGESRMGAVNVFGTSYDDYHVTAVGEVPLQTIQELAQGIMLQDEAPPGD